MSAGTVVVTGASTGIGEATARLLAGRGFRVLAGVRREEDARRLEADPSGRVRAVHLDVTSEADVAALATAVAGTEDGRLRALVNNAGVAVAGPVEVLTVADWRRQLEVNLLGQVAVTKELLPALLRSRGRVVNISSVGGLVAPPLLGPYAASKFALEAFTDVLRREVAASGVGVIAVEPGTVATPIWAKSRVGADARMAHVDEQVRARYAGMTAAVRAVAAQAGSRGVRPEAVADVVARAITARQPRTRYPVGPEARMQAWARRLLPDRAMDAAIRRAMRSPGPSASVAGPDVRPGRPGPPAPGRDRRHGERPEPPGQP